MLRNTQETTGRSRTHRWTFHIRSWFTWTLVVALYCSAFWLEGDTQHFVLLIASLAMLGALGVVRNRAACAGFVVGITLGPVIWWCINHIDPFYPKDRLFYFIVLTAFTGCAGMLAGFLQSLRHS